MTSDADSLGVEIETPISFLSKEQMCYISLHSLSPSSDTIYKAFSVLVAEPNPSSIVLTESDVPMGYSSNGEETCLAANFAIEQSHNEPWVEISVVDLNTDKLVLITAIQLALLEPLQPYHLIAFSQKYSLKLSVIRSPRSVHYQSYRGLELSLVPGLIGTTTPTGDLSQSMVSVEIAKLKPPPSYVPSIKFESYSKQKGRPQTTHTTMSVCQTHYSFLSEAAFQFRMESHFVVISISKLVSNSAVHWNSIPPEVIMYIELDTRILSSLATRPLVKNVTDKVVYLKGNQLAHNYQILLRLKRKEDPFLTLSSSEESPQIVPPTISFDSEELDRVRAELQRVGAERDILRSENISYEQRLESLQTVQHLPSFSQRALDQSTKTELIHKYLMLQQERDLLARKLDQSKELVDNLYISLEGYSELQQSFSETQESNLLQQEIVRHLQERAVRYKKLAKLCQNQERTIQSYEEHFQKLIDPRNGTHDVFTPYQQRSNDHGYETLRDLTEMDSKSDALVSVLQERLLQSSMQHRSSPYTQRQPVRRVGDMKLHAGKIEDRFLQVEDSLLPRMEDSRGSVSRGGGGEMYLPDIRDIIDSIPKLNKNSF